tara:strand:+ start:672 stop:1064 length:393 start_codon:yes stop_codon:yes gene_type:complete
MSLSNYPDGMDFGAYDDYHDPMLECGHREQSDCDCWCDGGEGDYAHLNDNCTGDDCQHLQCQSCFSPTDEKEFTVDNLQRQNAHGRALWVDDEKTKPLRFIPQNELEEARLCEACHAEYKYEIENKELIK